MGQKFDKIIRQLAIVFIMMAGSCVAHSAQPGPSDLAYSLNIPGQGSVHVETTSLTVGEAVADIQARADHESGAVLLSSDSEELITGAIQQNRLKQNIIVMPGGELVQHQEPRVTGLLKTYPSQLFDAVKKDKIGLMVVTFTTAYDSFIWIHSSQFSTFTATSNVMFTVMMSVVFSLNKDAWAQSTRPIQRFFKKILVGNKSLAEKSWGDIGVRFLASTTLASAISLARVPLISFDHLIEACLQLNTWTYPVLLGLISSVASFSWSENIASIDAETQPRAKFIFRRIQEARSLLLGTLASTAMLFSPQSYGATPWISLGASGGLGLIIYLNSKKITSWLETLPLPIKASMQGKSHPSGFPRCQAIWL